MNKDKDFDCVEMKRRGAARIHEITENMTREEEIEYWRKRSEEFAREQERLGAPRPAKKQG